MQIILSNNVLYVLEMYNRGYYYYVVKKSTLNLAA